MRVVVKAAFASIAAVAAGLLFALPAGAAVTSSVRLPPALKVSLMTSDRKPTVRIAPEMTVRATCSRRCEARVQLVLKTPTNALRLNRVSRQAAGTPWNNTVALSEYGFDYLSLVWRKSSLRVRVTATDLATSKRTVKTSVFRFRLR